MIGVYIILFVFSVYLSTTLVLRFITLKKYERLLKNEELILKGKKSVLNFYKVEMKKQFDSLKVEHKILSEHTEKLKKENDLNIHNKKELIGMVQFLTITSYNLYTYLVEKKKIIDKDMEYMNEEELIDIDFEFISSLSHEITGMYELVNTLNQYYNSLTGSSIIGVSKKKLTKKEILQGLNSSMN